MQSVHNFNQVYLRVRIFFYILFFFLYLDFKAANFELFIGYELTDMGEKKTLIARIFSSCEPSRPP